MLEQLHLNKRLDSKHVTIISQPENNQQVTAINVREQRQEAIWSYVHMCVKISFMVSIQLILHTYIPTCVCRNPSHTDHIENLHRHIRPCEPRMMIVLLFYLLFAELTEISLIKSIKV